MNGVERRYRKSARAEGASDAPMFAEKAEDGVIYELYDLDITWLHVEPTPIPGHPARP
jgi:hypothetical protein